MAAFKMLKLKTQTLFQRTCAHLKVMPAIHFKKVGTGECLQSLLSGTEETSIWGFESWSTHAVLSTPKSCLFLCIWGCISQAFSIGFQPMSSLNGGDITFGDIIYLRNLQIFWEEGGDYCGKVELFPHSVFQQIINLFLSLLLRDLASFKLQIQVCCPSPNSFGVWKSIVFQINNIIFQFQHLMCSLITVQI